MLEDETFDVVISGQAFEHIEYFWWTLEEMVRVLRPGGHMCILVPRGQNRHRFPLDTYRFDADGMIALARYANLEVLHASTNLAPPGAPPEFYSCWIADSMLVAKKAHTWSGFAERTGYKLMEYAEDAYATGFVSEEAQHYDQADVQCLMWPTDWINSMNYSEKGRELTVERFETSKKRLERIDTYFDYLFHEDFLRITERYQAMLEKLEEQAKPALALSPAKRVMRLIWLITPPFLIWIVKGLIPKWIMDRLYLKINPQ